jgi:hypothetical protein
MWNVKCESVVWVMWGNVVWEGSMKWNVKECEMWSVKCEVWRWMIYEVWSVRCEVWNVENIRNVRMWECEVWSEVR